MGKHDDLKKRRELHIRKGFWALTGTVLLMVCGGCSSGDSPTRTPVPTFTLTPVVAGAAPASTVEAPAAPTDTMVVEMPTATFTVTPVPPTPTSTAQPTETPTPEPTATTTPTAEPTEIPTPVPVATVGLPFDLEMAEKHPTTSLAPNVVRIFLFVADEEGFALPDYTLRVLHNGAELTVDKLSSGGLPGLTRGEPSPYTRFTNMNVIFVEAQAGTWEVQLMDSNGNPVGPPAEFQLDGTEDTRELYVRYRPLSGGT